MIICCGGEKGGTGKTMLATNLAVCFALRGKRVKLIDADRQGSSARWAGKRAESEALTAARCPFIPWSQLQGGVYFAVKEEAKHYDVVIVDAGGADSVEFESALAASEHLLSPVIPSDCDLATLAHIEQVLARFIGAGQTLTARVVLNHVSNHVSSDEADEARAVLADFQHMQVSAAQIHTRKAFRDAFKIRLSVAECAKITGRDKLPYLKAADEIWALYSELTGDLQRV